MKKKCCPPFSWDKKMARTLTSLPDRQIYKDRASGKSISYRRQEPARADTATRTLVFLHGFNGNSRSWHYQFSHFRAFRVISIDSPGFGDTSVCDGGMAGFADDVALFLSNLGIQSFWLVGHSMGGMLAQILAAKSGNHCKGLILSCTHKGRGRPETEPLSKDVQSRIEQRSRLNDHDYGTLRIERMLSGRLALDLHEFLVSIAGEIRVEAIKWGGAAIQHIDTTDYLPDITAPILILSSNQDIVVKPAALAALIADLPKAHHVEMQGVGHAPYCEDADTFNSLVERFIQQNSKP